MFTYVCVCVCMCVCMCVCLCVCYIIGEGNGRVCGVEISTFEID